MFTKKHPIISGLPVPLYVPPIKRKFNPTEFFFKSRKKNYSLMSTFVNQVLIDTEAVSGLPCLELLSISIPPGISDKIIIDQFEVKQGKIMSPIEVCQIIADITTVLPGQNFFPIDWGGTMTLIGYLPCHDGQIRSVTIYYDKYFRQWVVNCLGLSDWMQKIKFLIKRMNLLTIDTPQKN